MNMTWFPQTANYRYATKMFRAMSLCTAMASSAFFAGGDASAQQQASLLHEGQSFQVVRATDALSSVTPSEDTIALGGSGIQQVGMLSNCDDGSCGTSGGGLFGHFNSNLTSSCGNGSCSPGGNGGYMGSSSCYGGGSCMECPTCQPYKYARVEAVYMRREGLSNFTRSNNFSLDEYDFSWAPRVTIGSVPDCVNGTEISFVGPLNWDMSNSISNATGQTFLQELIPARALGSPIPEQTIGFTFQYDPEDVTLDVNGNIVSFDDDPLDPVNLQRQRYESTYWSAEASQTMMAWDIAKFSFGGRFINFEEDYSYTASNGPAANQNSFIASSATNNLIGLQVGLDVFTPIFCEHLSTFLRAKAGAYWNLSEGSAIVDDQGERLSGFSDDDGTLAAMIEISNGVQYQLGEALSVHAGSEFWYLSQVATADQQLPSLVGAQAASRGLSNGEDVLFVGFNFGATLKF